MEHTAAADAGDKYQILKIVKGDTLESFLQNISRLTSDNISLEVDDEKVFDISQDQLHEILSKGPNTLKAVE